MSEREIQLRIIDPAAPRIDPEWQGEDVLVWPVEEISRGEFARRYPATTLPEPEAGESALTMHQNAMERRYAPLREQCAGAMARAMYPTLFGEPEAGERGNG